MSKNQLSFGFAGLLLGFLLGFVAAYEISARRGGGSAHATASPRVTSPPLAGIGPGPHGGPPAEERGDARMTMETVNREIDALKGLLEREPGNTMALVRLGNIYFDAGMFEAAQEYYEETLRVEPDNVEIRTDLGTTLRSLNRPQEALDQFEQAVRTQPDHWRGWFNIGIVALYDLGDFERADTAFGKVAEIKPGTVDMQALKKEIDRVRAEKAAGGGSS